MYELPPEAFGYWFAGFTDGEGCFGIYKQLSGYRLMFSLAQRYDNREVLEYIQQTVGFGNVCKKMQGKSLAPMSSWTVTKKSDFVNLCTIFDTFPLQANKKRAEYLIWKEAVMEALKIRQGTYKNRDGSRSADWTKIGRLKEELAVERLYKDVA